MYACMYASRLLDRHQVLKIPVDVAQNVARRSHVHTARLCQEQLTHIPRHLFDEIRKHLCVCVCVWVCVCVCVCVCIYR